MSTATFTLPKRLMAGLVALGLALPMMGCDDSTGTDSSSMSLKLTDNPSPDLENAWVEITEIQLQGTAGQTVLLDESTGLIELTALAGTTQDLVSDVAVPSGEYSQLRIIVGAAAVEASSGDVFSRGGAASELGLPKMGELQCPSCTQTGFKVNLPDGSVTLETEAKIILLDFDVAETFGRQAGLSGQWVMDPLVRTSDFEVTGSVEGTVSADGVSFPSCGGDTTGVEDFVAELDDPDTGDKLASGDVASDGSYQIQFLNPETYATDYASPVTFENGDALDFDASASASTVTVEEGTAATVDYTINNASCTSG